MPGINLRRTARPILSLLIGCRWKVAQPVCSLPDAVCLTRQQTHPALPAMCCAQQAKMPRLHGSVVALRVLALPLVHWCAAPCLHLELLFTMQWTLWSMALSAKVPVALLVGFLVVQASRHPRRHLQRLHRNHQQAARAQPRQNEPLSNWPSSWAALTASTPRTCNSKRQHARQSRRVQKFSKLKV